MARMLHVSTSISITPTHRNTFYFVCRVILRNHYKRLLQIHRDSVEWILAKDQLVLTFWTGFFVIRHSFFTLCITAPWRSSNLPPTKTRCFLLYNFVTPTDGYSILLVAFAMERTLRRSWKNFCLLIVATRLSKHFTFCPEAMIICKTRERGVNN